MSNRVRLTARMRQGADASIPYPGNVNQPDRTDPAHDKYDNWQEVINHPLPDMRHEWKDDERDDIGFGIPEAWGTNPATASVRVAANKAVKLAYLLLGEKVAESVIEDQASDFMMLGPGAIDRSLARFAKTQALYAADKAEEAEADDDEPAEGSKKAGEVPEAFKKNWKKDDEKADEKPAEEKKEGKKASAELAEKAQADVKPAEGSTEGAKKAAEEKPAEKPAEEKVEEKPAAKKAEEKDDKPPAFIQDKIDKKEEAKAKAKKAEDEAEDDDDDDDDGETEAEAEEPPKSKKGSNELDIELSSSMEGSMEPGEGDARIAALFDDGIPAELPEPGAGKKASAKKEGVKKLGGQPRVASDAAAAADISAIWDAPPDVSELFK